MDNQEMTFEMMTENGPVNCLVLFTFYSEQTDAHYMLYTTDDPDKVEQITLSAARYDPEQLSAIYPLQGEEDRAIINRFLEYVSSHNADELADELAESRQEEDGPQTIEDL